MIWQRIPVFLGFGGSVGFVGVGLGYDSRKKEEGR
jgi:hypothetical protein